MIPRARLLLTATLGVLVACAARVDAQLPGAGSPAPGPAHGWAILPSTSAAGVCNLVHLPPRTDGPDSSAAQTGAASRATTLRFFPEAMCAWEGRLYMAFPPEAAEGNTQQRRVLTLAAEPGPVSTIWVTDSAGRRLDAIASLPGDGALLGLACAPQGPVALLETSSGDARLLAFDGSSWAPLALPPDAGTPVGIFSAPDGFGLVSRAAAEPRIFRARSAGAFADLGWSPEPLRFTRTDRAPAPFPADLRLVAGQYVYTVSRGSAVQLWNPTPAATYLLATIPKVGAPFALVPLEDVARVALVWTDPPPAPTGPDAKPAPGAQETTHLAEVSVLDGALVYSGPAILAGPISSQELKLLAVALVGVMGLILIFVLRPESTQKPINLPKGVALAEPGRRAAAGLIDALAAGLIGAAITGVPLSALVIGYGADRDQNAGTLLVAILAAGIAHGTIGEWLFGRTLGKLLAGCGVARPRTVTTPDGEAVPALSRPTLARALIRNTIKWLIPPLAILGMNGPDFRHRGDVAAGTIVFRPVQPREPES